MNKLSELILDPKAFAMDRDVDIYGVTSNSKSVASGYLFVAVSGHASDGADFHPHPHRACDVRIAEGGALR